MAGRLVGNYVLENEIGTGSFSVVWRARHIHHGYTFAIKEIATQNLCQQLREAVISEINILNDIKHPNIIRLYDTFNDRGKIYLVLEYCNGGDLFSYIQRCGRLSEDVARHFIIQLAAGLKVLRENHIIHRDLKPHNLLLSKNGEDTVLKIADFGLARLLEPQGLAETFCGSPLYMAPEIMKSQKYDAKADLWSLGIILFQLVTGRVPYLGNSRIDLMKNIMSSHELKFPSDIVGDLKPDCVDLCKKLLRRNPIERLSFEEFFNHRFMVQPIGSLGGHENRSKGSGDSHENRSKGSGDSHENRSKGSGDSHENSSKGSGDSPVVETSEISEAFCIPTLAVNLGQEKHVGTASPKGMVDSMEHLIEEDYVFLNADTLYSSLSAFELDSSQSEAGVCSTEKIQKSIGAPMHIVGTALGSSERGSSIPLETSQASVTSPDMLEKPSDHPPTRLDLLQSSAHLIAEIARENFQTGQHMEAFAIQLVCLATWKQAMRVSHDWVASFKESSSLEVDFHGATTACSQIKQEFIWEVESAERLASHLGPALEGSAEMPDAMEILLQTALAMGRKGAIDELCGAMDNTAALYSKSRTLLSFILVEASSLELNPSFSLSASDRQRLRLYTDSLILHNQSTAYSSALEDMEASKVSNKLPLYCMKARIIDQYIRPSKS